MSMLSSQLVPAAIDVQSVTAGLGEKARSGPGNSQCAAHRSEALTLLESETLPAAITPLLIILPVPGTVLSK